MQCKKCGTIIKDEEKFCANCGEIVIFVNSNYKFQKIAQYFKYI